MLHGSKVAGKSAYLVPCVFKALQLLETLRRADAGLRVDDFLETTGYSRSTIYRILRTLATCNYITQDAQGLYCLNQEVISPLGDEALHREVRRTGPRRKLLEDGLEFERWGVRFRSDGSRATEAAESGAVDSGSDAVAVEDTAVASPGKGASSPALSSAAPSTY